MTRTGEVQGSLEASGSGPSASSGEARVWNSRSYRGEMEGGMFSVEAAMQVKPWRQGGHGLET